MNLINLVNKVMSYEPIFNQGKENTGSDLHIFGAPPLLSPAEQEENAKKIKAETDIINERKMWIILKRVGTGILIGIPIGVVIGVLIALKFLKS